jgi:ubiquinone/menaquinone biosynthesis C-methylase UbiE
VLAVACGTGEFERLLAERYPEQTIAGVDFSENMIAIAAQKCRAYPYMGFQVASATALPWASPSFDRVVCANAFHYFERPEQVLAEMHRVLQQSGTVVIL